MDGVSPRDAAEYERPKHGHRIRRGPMEMPGDFPCRIEPADRSAAAEHPRIRVGLDPPNVCAMAPTSGQARKGTRASGRAQLDFRGDNPGALASPSARVSSKREVSPVHAAL